MKHLPLVQFVFKIKPVSVYPLPFRYITMYPPRVVRTCPCILSCNRERVWYYWLILKLKVTFTQTSNEASHFINQSAEPPSQFPGATVNQTTRQTEAPHPIIASSNQPPDMRATANQRVSQSKSQSIRAPGTEVQRGAAPPGWGTATANQINRVDRRVWNPVETPHGWEKLQPIRSIRERRQPIT